MLRLFCAALAALVLLPAARPAFAQDDEEEPEEGEAAEVDYNRTGLYLQLAGDWGVQEFDDTNNINVDDSLGVSGRVGYRMLSWLSAEVQAQYLPDFQLDFPGDSHDNGNIDMWTVGGNLRWNLPTGLIQPYLVTGGGYMDAHLRHGWPRRLREDRRRLRVLLLARRRRRHRPRLHDPDGERRQPQRPLDHLGGDVPLLARAAR
jgi:hypothetical protein